MKKQYLITFIHGTFAKNSAWVQENSEVRNILKNEINGDLIFDILAWSGKNSHHARYNAAINLEQKLLKQIADYPHHQKVVIAHSHGGNIALYALNLIGEEAKHFKVVTMATPFLNVRLRNFLENLETFKGLSYLSFGLFIIVVTLMIITSISVYILELFGIHGENSFVIGLFIAMASVVYLIKYFIENINQKIDAFIAKVPAQVKETFLKYSYANTTLENSMLIVIDKSDEVKFIFKNLLSFWNILFNFSEKLFIYSRKFTLYFFILILPVSIIMGLASEYIKTHPSGTKTLTIIMYIFMAPLMVFFYTLFLTPPLILAVIMILYATKSNPISLGWEGLNQQLFIDTSISKLPDLKTEFSLKEYNFPKKSLFDLRHSIYNHREVITAMGNWINQL
jgi:hypothetical protein